MRSEQRPQSVLVTRANPPNLVGDATMIFGLDVARTLYNDQASTAPPNWPLKLTAGSVATLPPAASRLYRQAAAHY